MSDLFNPQKPIVQQAVVQFEKINADFNSPEFEGINYDEFAIIRSQAGLNRFTLLVRQWVTKTKLKGIIAKVGYLNPSNSTGLKSRQD